jgi:hypothetical protein
MHYDGSGVAEQVGGGGGYDPESAVPPLASRTSCNSGCEEGDVAMELLCDVTMV